MPVRYWFTRWLYAQVFICSGSSSEIIESREVCFTPPPSEQAHCVLLLLYTVLELIREHGSIEQTVGLIAPFELHKPKIFYID